MLSECIVNICHISKNIKIAFLNGSIILPFAVIP